MENLEIIQFKKILKDHDNFITKSRIRLFTLLSENPKLTINELISLSTQDDQATVYRNLSLFESLGIIKIVRLGWHTKVELSDLFQRHHHHFSCKNCGKVWNIEEDKLIESRINLIANKMSFYSTDHQLEIIGICKECKRNISKNQGSPGRSGVREKLHASK